MEKEKLMEYIRKAVACHNENPTDCLGRNCCDCPHDYPVETIDLIESALELLEEGKKDAEQDRWIPCSVRLPEENGRYIICYEDATTFLDYFNGKWFFPLGKHAMACEETGTIVAWRPLPEPYTEEEA